MRKSQRKKSIQNERLTGENVMQLSNLMRWMIAVLALCCASSSLAAADEAAEPIGAVTADELPPGAVVLKVQTRLNGNVLQSDNTANMIFPVAETLVDLTQAMTLMPGDVIVTGTPSGVGHARKPPLWMKHGDVCEIDIEGVGVLVNPVEDEKKA